MARSTSKTNAKTKKAAATLTSLPDGFALLRVGSYVVPARVITQPETGAESATRERPLYRELSRDRETSPLCACEQDALDVIALYLANSVARAESERLAELARVRDAEQRALWANESTKRPRVSDTVKRASSRSRGKKAQKASAA